MEELTDDRRPLYQITDPETRVLRYREMYYECNRRERGAWITLIKVHQILQRIVEGDETALDDAKEYLAGKGAYGSA